MPGSPEEGYTDIPYASIELASVVGACSLNPLANLPFDPYTLPAPAAKRKVLVVGGGVGGMQAAITAADRGHEVLLVERTGRLGGVLNFTDVDVDKPDLRNFRDTLIADLKAHDVEIRVNVEVSPANLAAFDADALVIATGAKAVKPGIPGIDTAHQAIDIYDGKVVPGEHVIMVGGGLIGAETGLHLAKTGHEVTIVELLPKVATEAFGMYREALMLELAKENVKLLANTHCLGLGPDYVRVQTDGEEERTLECDTVLYALGMRSLPTSALKASAEELGMRVWLVGDAISPGKVDQATRTGYLAAIEI
jgi:NADPH-dependent 2,4-dienoyl-CoA reductase/sulfur reductase-like enzyme